MCRLVAREGVGAATANTKASACFMQGGFGDIVFCATCMCPWLSSSKRPLSFAAVVGNSFVALSSPYSVASARANSRVAVCWFVVSSFYKTSVFSSHISWPVALHSFCVRWPCLALRCLFAFSRLRLCHIDLVGCLLFLLNLLSSLALFELLAAHHRVRYARNALVTT